MIDWHTHILPGMDDGSRDVAESISMINMQVSQGVSTIIATPHFYANDETVESFLERRKKSFELLKNEFSNETVEIKLGAEVRYYQGISRMNDLKYLRIEGSKLLLLEMPMSSWTESMIRELIELSGKNSINAAAATKISTGIIMRMYFFIAKTSFQMFYGLIFCPSPKPKCFST